MCVEKEVLLSLLSRLTQGNLCRCRCKFCVERLLQLLRRNVHVANHVQISLRMSSMRVSVPSCKCQQHEGMAATGLLLQVLELLPAVLALACIAAGGP